MIPSGQGQTEQGISQEGNFLRKVTKNGTILNNQLKCSFFTWQQPCYNFFFFLRQVISSVLVALKCWFLWANSWCILPLIAVSHSSYSAFLLRILLRKRRFNYWEIVYHFCLGILTHSMNMLHSSSFLSSYWKGRNSYPSSLRNY